MNYLTEINKGIFYFRNKVVPFRMETFGFSSSILTVNINRVYRSFAKEDSRCRWCFSFPSSWPHSPNRPWSPSRSKVHRRHCGERAPAGFVDGRSLPQEGHKNRSSGLIGRAEGRSQTVTFPWWVPKTERITSEISPSVA
jgi:hypothetical protein